MRYKPILKYRAAGSPPTHWLSDSLMGGPVEIYRLFFFPEQM